MRLLNSTLTLLSRASWCNYWSIKCPRGRYYIWPIFIRSHWEVQENQQNHISLPQSRKSHFHLLIWVKLFIYLKALWKAICSCRKFSHLTQAVMIEFSLQELNHFRGNCSMLYHYDWISVPLVYTQVSCQTLSTQMLFHWWMFKHILLLAFLVCVSFFFCLEQIKGLRPDLRENWWWGGLSTLTSNNSVLWLSRLSHICALCNRLFVQVSESSLKEHSYKCKGLHFYEKISRWQKNNSSTPSF